MTHEINRYVSTESLRVYCTCRSYFESSGHDESSRNAINNWITEHRKQNP